MNKENLSNPIYKRLFPETYAKNQKIKATLDFINDRFQVKRVPGTELLSMDLELNIVG